MLLAESTQVCAVFLARQGAAKKAASATRNFGLRLLAAWLLVTAGSAGAEAIPHSVPGQDFFASPTVSTFQIKLSEDALKSLRRQPRKPVEAVVTVDGTVYEAVGIHLKGAAGSFRGVDDKPGLSLSFDAENHRQRFHGLRKIMLNNSVQDPSFVNEHICGELFRAAGVPVPRTANAMVELNGRKLGLYVLKESYSRDFLGIYFDNTRGNLYDIGAGNEVTERMKRNGGDGPDDWSDLKRLADAAREPDPAKVWPRLQEVLDVDLFLSFMAMEIMTCHWDGYCQGRNNFRIYFNLDKSRFVFFPNDMDQMFQNPAVPWKPGMNGLVAQAVMRSPEGARRYEERFRSLYTNVFLVEVLTNRISQLAARIRPALAAWNPNAARDFDGQANAFRERIQRRALELNKQLGLVPASLVKFENGSARLRGWLKQADQGTVRLDQVKLDNKPALHIKGEGGPSVGSWRTRVRLPPGKYRFVGQARAAGLTPLESEVGAGGGLRISGGKRQNKLTGDAPWTSLAFEFTSSADTEDTELVCELRATQGEIWFDAASLRLEQVK